MLKESPVKNIDNSRSFKNYDYYNQEINSPPSEDAMNNSFGQNFGIKSLSVNLVIHDYLLMLL